MMAHKWRCLTKSTYFLLLLLLPNSLAATEDEKKNTKEVKNNNKEDESPNLNFNPMELYVDDHEGVSLTHDDGGQTFFSFFNEDGSYISDFKSQEATKYTRVLVKNTTQENVYQLTFFTHKDQNKNSNKTERMRVHRNSDGTVSLSCESNNKFMTWADPKKSKSDDFPEKQVALSSNLGSAPVPFCVKDGICPTCKYNLVVGSITDLRFNILNVTFETPQGGAPTKPSQVSEKSIFNYGDEPIESTLTVSYSYETMDETSWEQGWGFEASASATASVEIGPDFAKTKGEFSVSAKVSYDGRNGKKNSITETQSVEDSLLVNCPARTACYLKYTAEKIDNFNVPFTAWVEKSTDAGTSEYFQQRGSWMGTNTLNFKKIFCTENLDSDYSNCPMGMGDGEVNGTSTRMASSANGIGEKIFQKGIIVLLLYSAISL